VTPLTADTFRRPLKNLRLSVTDRCNLRCAYCMPEEEYVWLPGDQILSFEELSSLADRFVALGVDKIRLTGGEPLVRKGVMTLVRSLGARIGAGGLRELTLTTNGTQLAKMADDLFAAGVRRINVSMDTLDPATFAAVTRWGKLEQTLDGIFAAKAAGLAIKINAVALKGVNEDEFDRMVAWCGEHGFDLCLIETMPMGDIGGDRTDQYQAWTLEESDYRTGGPARYMTVKETGRRIGFITPMTHNFCESCNRVRLTCTGTLFMCLGQDDAAEFRELLRDPSVDDAALAQAIRDAIARKPRGHDFVIDRRRKAPAVARHMSMTGG
jgi:GTP 3',8-cyclase